MRYLLLHGFTGTPDSLAALEAPPGSVTPTLGGHLDRDVTGDFLDEVERLAELGRDCQGLFGYSLGGRLALGILARYPQRFAHAVIVSAQPGLASAGERDARRSADARLVELLRTRGLEAFMDHWQALPLWASQGALADDVKAAQRQQRLRHRAAPLAQSLVQHGLGEMPDFRAQLPLVQSEVDVVVGERDLKFVALGQELTKLMPHSRLTVAEGAGHNLVLERPALCASLLRRGEPT
ncbi:MAG TPA: alpha/beta fold hydrolase [Polyangiaceae bacterium]|nr:alpha/beta fold hydrolase [Polyangiaceae bacterium]